MMILFLESIAGCAISPSDDNKAVSESERVCDFYLATKEAEGSR